MPKHNKKLENEFSFSGFCWFKAVIIGVSYVMLLYATSSSSPEVAFLLLFSEKTEFSICESGSCFNFVWQWAENKTYRICNFSREYETLFWDLFAIVLCLLVPFDSLFIKKTRFVVLTMFRCSFEFWKELLADGIFHSFSMNALIRSQPETSNKSPIYLPFNFSRLLNLLQGKNFLVLSSSVERYYKTEFLIFLADVIVNSGFPNFTDQNNSSDLLQKVDPLEEGIKNRKDYCFLLVLITNLSLKLVIFFHLHCLRTINDKLPQKHGHYLSA